LSILGKRTNTSLSYPKFSLYWLRKIFVPNFAALRSRGGGKSVDELARVFDEQSDNNFLPLPEIKNDPVRRELDKSVTEVLGMDPETVEKIRDELSKEPMITRKRYNG